MNNRTDAVINEIEKVIIGKREVVERVLMAILSEGHILLDDVPGVADGETDGDALIAGVVAAIAGNVAGDAFKTILAPAAGVISAAFTFGTEEFPAAERKSVPAKSQASVFV